MPGPAPSRKVAPEPEEKMRKKKVQLDGVVSFVFFAACSYVTSGSNLPPCHANYRLKTDAGEVWV